MEINHFKGNGPEWLVHKRTLCFWQREGLWEGERESTYWCVHAALTLYLFLFFSSKIPLSYLFFLLRLFLNTCFLFPGFQIPNTVMLVSSFFLYTERALYSAYCDLILLFWPLTTFLWSGCTCRLPLVRLCATLHRQTKENYFVCLFVVASFLAMVWKPSLSLSFMACT